MKGDRRVSRDARLVARKRHLSQENELVRLRDELSRRIGIVSALLAFALFAANAWAGAGSKAAVGPAAFTIGNDKLYLSYDEDVQEQWSADLPNLVAQADGNWPDPSRLTEVVE